MKGLKTVLSLAAALSVAGTAFAGDMVINGSTTVLPIAQAAAEKFMAANGGAIPGTVAELQAVKAALDAS